MIRSTARARRLVLRLSCMATTMLLLAAACSSDDSDGSAAQAPATTVTSTTVAPPPDPVEEPPPTTTEAPASTTTEAPAETTTTAPAAALDEGEHSYQRIVSISPTGTEFLYAIGAGDRVVAVDSYSYYPPEAPVTDLSGFNPNIEAIASYEPDLVVMGPDGDVIASLDAIGISTLVIDAPATFEDVYTQIDSFGETLDQQEAAAQLIADMQDRIAELIEAAPDATGFSYYHELTDSLYTVTSGTFVGHVYSLFGLTNVADPADEGGSGYPQLSEEYLLDVDPDLIFLADTLCCAQNAETVAARPGWELLSAVRNGHVVELNDDIVSRWGPRLLEFIEAISDVLTAIGSTS